MEPQETQFSTGAGGDGPGTPGPAAARNGYGTSTSLGRQGFSADHRIAAIMADSLRNNRENVKTATARAVGPDLLRGLLMLLMAMDHTVGAINSWPHAQGSLIELDGIPITRWNRPIGYAIRTMTHLCAPGFFFLLGMGTVYFGRSRSRLGWSAFAVTRHFVIRASVLTVLTVLMGMAMGFGTIWFLNVVLFALGFDYLVVGLLWLLFSKTEPALASTVTKAARLAWGKKDNQNVESHASADDEALRPLLPSLQRQHSPSRENGSLDAPGARTSYHIHNLLILVLVGVTIWWNIWLSPNGGRCISTNSDGSLDTQPFPKTGSGFIDFWFHVYVTDRVISIFPAMGWLSFAIAGLLYARLVLHPAATPARIRSGTLVASLVLAVVFVLTRLLHFGNLSEDCFFTPDQGISDIGHPRHGNQYLASPQAFFYLTKYPPDVAFFAYTLSVNLLFLTALDCVPRVYLPKTSPPSITDSAASDGTAGARRALAKAFTTLLTVLLTFGNSALFFYIVHQFVVYGAGSILTKLFGREVPGEKNPLDGQPLIAIQSIWAFWGVWLLVIVIMFPLCRWYARFKSTKSVDSVWRFF
ncbi:uncharacterized protein B0I36DRAFT_310553 [Microdochium trichocladiopsis]|uniref:Heparan-alpha-glucosaminide N-acetyltransferase catalytic domain-containing protein n=1 Tax=Microdochium trichocladiopsis TaxID=1682393 RepID=A0A9P8YJX0_9PEZI|nr:uncharacterized protein B0I36DRAFT_310553 [Microdochium trichocladiopsis]KAH7040374.1 hypothetical protein B0I36DRAFT_310553 [Microdochium trichocladiopsis]